jgi:Pyruvate/2-oxoacid:ferredoxin oxidoreductase gamma subunit
VILVDDFFVRKLGRAGVRQKSVPATATAMEKVGNKVAANFVMMGAAVGYSGLVGRPEMEAAIRNLVSGRFQEVNLAAFDLGLQMGQALPATEVGPWR